MRTPARVLGLIILLVATLVLPALEATAATTQGAVISNGTVQLGVNREGHLNYNCVGSGDSVCPSQSIQNTAVVGLRNVALNAEGTAPGCLCEGWGVADAGTGLFGWANKNFGSGSMNLTSVSFTSTATTATSTVTVSSGAIPGAELEVVHDYHPSPESSNLYEVTVTITNTGTVPLTDVRYRRVMDWDVEPTAFSEWVTIQGSEAAENVLFASDDGFASASPLAPRSYHTSQTVCGGGYTGGCDFVDLGTALHPSGGPSDHGALFDFGFGSLAPEASTSFATYYGAANSEANALAALAAVEVEVFSLGQTNCGGSGDPANCGDLPPGAGPVQGQPVTFMFAFTGVGGDPILDAPSIEKEADDEVTEVGGTNGYTITVSNPNEDEVTLDSISDTLPAGFEYVPGSTSGLTAEEPDIALDLSGDTLTWDDLDPVPASDDASLRFDVTVSSTPGEYFNDAAAAAGELTIPPVEDVARVEVVGPPTILKVATEGSVGAGELVRYSIEVENHNVSDIRVESVSDTMPAGFSYVPGSTDGVTDDDPLRSGQTLTWDGPFTVGDESSISLAFTAVSSAIPGTYFNVAAADTTGLPSVSTGPTAAVIALGDCLAPTLPGTRFGETLRGTDAADVVSGLGGRDLVDGLEGDDRVCGGPAGDYVYGRHGADQIVGEDGPDRLFGGKHADAMVGGPGRDAFSGGKGADVIDAQDGTKDCILTGPGNDTVHADSGLDLVDPKRGCPPGF